jgi:hypothetical protein
MKASSRVFVLLSLGLLVVTFMSAQGTRPRELEGEFMGKYVALQWNHPETDTAPSFYKIYRSAGMNFPSVLAKVSGTMYRDSAISLNTLYHYFVTAVHHDTAESLPSNIIQVFTGQGGGDSLSVRIMFTSVPVLSGSVNKPYEYDATVATVPPGTKVCFHLSDAPSGMTVNDSTGVIRWTPATSGIFEVELVARSCSNSWGGAEQEFRVMVFSGKPGRVVGTLTNDSGKGLSNVAVKLFDVSRGDFVMRTQSDSAGHYTFPYVNPAIYLVRARPDNDTYVPQWYHNASNIGDATPVTVPESTTVTVDFVLHHRDTALYRISGTVMDSSTHPIAGARVTIFRVEHDSTGDNMFDQGNDFGHGDDGLDLRADSSGNYSAKLHRGTFIIGARAEGYLRQFWNHKPSALDADHLHLTSDTSGINFNLHHRFQGSGSISGFILKKADSTALHSHVIGFQRDSLGHYNGVSESTGSDSTGQYTLDHLPNGSFTVLAFAGEHFVPTFYSLSGGTPVLDSATAVVVTGGAVSGIDLYLPPDTGDGLNDIDGNVAVAASSGSTAISSITPLGGAIVTLVNSSNVAVGSSVSLNDGSYIVRGIAPGTYSAIFQKPGFTSATTPVSVSYVNNMPSTTTLNAQLSSGPGIGRFGTMSVQQHWNLVSLPVSVADANVSVLFPSSISNAFRYDIGSSAYVSSNSLDYGAGYWLRFSAAQVFALSGSSRTTETITLNQGWNLIGSLSTSAPVASITTSPSNLITSEFFGYKGSYTPASSLDPGQGYWVKASAVGTMTISAGSAVPKISSSNLTRLNSLTFRDGLGRVQVLYFGEKSNVDAGKTYELPPPGPAEAFDVRFASQRYVEVHSSNLTSSVNFPIQLQSAVSPLTISWSIRNSGVKYTLVDAQGRPLLAQPLTGDGSISSQGNVGLTLTASGTSLPKEYTLHQNYPNPFNPSTSIAFDLPASSIVTLKVYNILGQEVASVLNGVRFDAGSHSTIFDASRLSSGMYFYRIQAGTFTSTKKMMLLK